MRKHFHVPNRYFLTHSVGCLPVTTPNAVQESIFSHWQSKGGDAWPNWMDVITEFRTEIGHLLGVNQADMCPQTNVSSGLTKIIYSLPKRTGRKTILLTKQDFPTIGFVLKQAEREGYTLRFVEGDITDVKAWSAAMDETVQLALITHALSNTSQLLPVKNICELAGENGVFSIVDIAQSVGIVPIHLPDWEADFALGSSVKYLCGGPGACFLYAAPHMIEQCTPLDVGWFSHENPFEMDIENFRFAADAMRFFGGTPSPIPFATSLNALKLRNTIGAFYDHVQDDLSALSAAVPRKYLISPTQPEKRAGTLVVNPDDRGKLRTALAKNEILHDERTQGFRFSIHGYTPAQDIDLLKSILREVF